MLLKPAADNTQQNKTKKLFEIIIKIYLQEITQAALN